MWKLIRVFDEAAICLSMLAVVYFWVGLVIISLSSFIYSA